MEYEHFYLVLPYIVQLLEVIQNTSRTHSEIRDLDKIHADDWDTKAKKEATSYIKALTDFPFIVGLITWYSLHNSLKGVSNRLQGRIGDIAKVFEEITTVTVQKMKFFNKDFFSKYDQIRMKLRIWSHLLKKSLTENFIFCAVSKTNDTELQENVETFFHTYYLESCRLAAHLSVEPNIPRTVKRQMYEINVSQ